MIIVAIVNVNAQADKAIKKLFFMKCPNKSTPSLGFNSRAAKEKTKKAKRKKSLGMILSFDRYKKKFFTPYSLEPKINANPIRRIPAITANRAYP
jgi:hypothetical protein